MQSYLSTSRRAEFVVDSTHGLQQSEAVASTKRIVVRVGVLTNLQAGRKDTRLQRVLSFLKGRPDILHIETEEYPHVREALSLLLEKGVDILVVNGGDGTLQHALTELLRNGSLPTLPAVVPLCGGRTNMNALVIGSHHNPVTALSTLLTSVRNNTLTDRLVTQPVLRVHFGSEQPIQYGMCFGVGALHRAVALKHQILPHRRFQGLPGAAAFLSAMLARAVFGSANGLFTPDRIELTFDAQSRAPRDYLLVLATSLHHLFFKLQPFWGHEPAPIRFTAITPEARRTPGGVMRVLRGQPPFSNAEQAGYLSHNVSQIELQLDCGLLLDGELFAPKQGRTVRITADHRLRFVRTN